MCVRSEYIFVHGCECVFSMFVEMLCAHVRVCVTAVHVFLHIFSFSTFSSAVAHFPKKEKRKADSQRGAVGSSFRERSQGFVLTRTERRQNLKG